MIARLARVTMVLSAAVLAGALSATAQSDPFVGTWRLNVAKSTYSPGPAPKSITSIYEAAGTGIQGVGDERVGHRQDSVFATRTNLDGQGRRR